MRRMLRFLLAPTLATAALLLAASGLEAQVIVYAENFEGGAPGWTLTSTSPPVAWAADNTPIAGNSAPNSLNYNNGTSYSSGTANSGNATSPAVDLSALTAPSLTFWCNYQTETTGTTFDTRRLQISNNGFTSMVANVQLAGTVNNGAGLCAAMGTWHQHTLALDPAWGTVQLRFRFDTVDSIGNSYQGWFVDDLAVSGTVTYGALPQIFSPQPSSGAIVTSATPTFSAGVVRSTGATTVHAEYVIDGASAVDGSVVTNFGTSTFVPSTPLAEGSHTLQARAHDDSGAFSALTAATTFTVELSPPVAGTVNDGLGPDIDVQTGRTVIAANWSGFSDAQSGIASYAWAIGTTPGGTQIQAFTSVGAATRANTGPSLTLLQSVRYYVTVRATNGVGLQTLVTSNGVQVMSLATATPLPLGQVGAAYSEILTASFGTGPHTFALTSGTLPPSLSLAANGALTGTPTTPGRYVFGVIATDSLSATQFRDYTLVIYPASPTLFQMTGNPAADTGLEWGVLGFAYSRTFSAQGGASPLVWSLSGGALPSGVILDSLSGTISGTVSGSPGTYTAQITVSDSDDPTVRSTASYSIVIAGAVAALSITTPATLQTGRTGSPYAQILAATGGVRPLTWSIAGSLPAGLALSGDGVISGTPTTVETATFNLTVTDAAGSTATLGSATLDVQAEGGALSLWPLSLPVAVVGNAYPITFQATGGTAPYAWSVSSGALPPGLALSAATGAITGTPTTRGYYRFVVTALDAGGLARAASAVYSVSVLGATVGTNYVIVTTTPLAYAVANQPYQGLLSILGGTGPHSWTVVSGALPAGLTLDPVTGLISGTPTASGASSFTVSVVSTNGLSTLETFSLPVTTGILPAIATLPATLTFRAAVIGANPPAQTVTLIHSGAGTLGWTVLDDAGWLTVAPGSGYLGAQESTVLTLLSDHTGLEAGTYTATVTVTAAGASNSPQSFFVTLVIDPLPAVDQPDSGYCGLLGLEGLIPLAWMALRRRRRPL